jgi:CHAT domain-containing protein
MFNAGLPVFEFRTPWLHMIPILRSCHVKKLFKSVTTMALVAGLVIPGYSSAQTGDALMTQAYFVQQGSDEALLIRINSFEAEFESRLSDQAGKLLLVSGIPNSRIVPVFQYINAPQSPRQLDIEVTSNRHTDRSKFDIELTRLKSWDNRSNSVSRAYQLLSYGMETGGGDSETNWTAKIDSLKNAGKLFQNFGMIEMRLWSNYLAAHLIHYHLHDHNMVNSMAGEILADARGSRMRKIELATMQLQSAAFIGLKRSDSLQTSPADADPVQSVLARIGALADSLGFGFEQAQALYVSGTEYAHGGFYIKALGQFQLAVGIADSLGDEELATGIRESIVLIHSIQGNAPASSEVLQEIEAQLVEDGGGDKLALNLLAQGRLLIRSYQYAPALETLLQALNYQNDSAIRKQVNFELAKVFYATGRPDESKVYLQLAGVNPAAGGQKIRSNSVIDVGEGLWILANSHRAMDEYEQMRMARSAQGLYRPMPARYLYDQGLDELAMAGMNHQRAQSLFRQSLEAANATGNQDLKHLSLLQFCALASPPDSSQALCSDASVKTAYTWLTNGGIVQYSTEAMFLRAKIMRSNGRRSEAISTMDRLGDEIHLLRHSLPGVLGAWYQERHEDFFEYYLELLSSADAKTSLLALSKIRYIEKYTAIDAISNDASRNSDLLRNHLAQRRYSGPGQMQTALIGNINRDLADIRVSFRKKFKFLSKAGLQKYLRSLSNDEMVLTYHVSPTIARVWVAHKGKVRQREITNPADLYKTLQEARQGLADLGMTSFDRNMNDLGKRLIDPVADWLTETIYWIPAGPLLGFPLDALRLNGRYLLESHRVVNLLSFPANVNPGSSLRSGQIRSVFLAGHPQDYSSDYAIRLDTSSEIQAIADIFVGPGLHIVQGAALLPDEFQEQQFQKAGLIHLSMPGIINLKYPEQSRLELSGDENSRVRASFKPADIRSLEHETRLVFLSATKVNSYPDSVFNNQPGLITDFVDAGVNSVIASLWRINGDAAETLMTRFYRKLDESGNISSALTDARRQYLENNKDRGLYDWAGYQIFID